MARLTPLHLIPALIAAASHAGEVTIELRPFAIEKSFNAAALPGGNCVLLKLDPKAWADFKIVQIAEHGSTAAKGTLLVRFDSEEIDKKIVDARSALESSTLALAQAGLDARIFQETAPNKLEAARRAAEIAKEEKHLFHPNPAQGHRGHRIPSPQAQRTNPLQPARGTQTTLQDV